MEFLNEEQTSDTHAPGLTAEIYIQKKKKKQR